MQYGLEQSARQYEIQQQEAARQNETRLQLNPGLNSILDLCLKSLPNGIHSVIKDLVTQVCAANNGELDACHIMEKWINTTYKPDRPRNQKLLAIKQTDI
jgi:hypothetical protein